MNHLSLVGHVTSTPSLQITAGTVSISEGLLIEGYTMFLPCLPNQGQTNKTSPGLMFSRQKGFKSGTHTFNTYLPLTQAYAQVVPD